MVYGKTISTHRSAGYQEALADINALIINGGGLDRISEWIKDNRNSALSAMYDERVNELNWGM